MIWIGSLIMVEKLTFPSNFVRCSETFSCNGGCVQMNIPATLAGFVQKWIFCLPVLPVDIHGWMQMHRLRRFFAQADIQHLDSD